MNCANKRVRQIFEWFLIIQEMICTEKKKNKKLFFIFSSWKGSEAQHLFINVIPFFHFYSHISIKITIRNRICRSISIESMTWYLTVVRCHTIWSGCVPNSISQPPVIRSAHIFKQWYFCYVYQNKREIIFRQKHRFCATFSFDSLSFIHYYYSSVAILA